MIPPSINRGWHAIGQLVNSGTPFPFYKYRGKGQVFRGVSNELYIRSFADHIPDKDCYCATSHYLGKPESGTAVIFISKLGDLSCLRGYTKYQDQNSDVEDVAAYWLGLLDDYDDCVA
jgi:hypothetical protein